MSALERRLHRHRIRDEDMISHGNNRSRDTKHLLPTIHSAILANSASCRRVAPGWTRRSFVHAYIASGSPLQRHSGSPGWREAPLVALIVVL